MNIGLDWIENTRKYTKNTTNRCWVSKAHKNTENSKLNLALAVPTS